MSDPSPPPLASVGITVGSRVAGYRLEEQIGRGGMAVVFRAHDERLDRQVALKVLAPVLAEDEAFQRRFIRESRAAAAVDDPNIIPIYDAGEADGVLFIAMRLVRGGNLRALVARHGPLTAVRAGWILSAVASALDAAHASGLIHRDVKPANMLLDTRAGRPDHVYLSDFGVSKASLGTSGLTGSGQFIGTVDYAAPEQIQGRTVDGRSDQYALGCSAFELLTGRPPFAREEWVAAMYAHLSDTPPPVATLRAGLPDAADAVFARVLAKAPDDRYPSCLEFAGALRSALGLSSYNPASDAQHDEYGAPAGAEDDDFTLDPAAGGRNAVVLTGPVPGPSSPGAGGRGTNGSGAAPATELADAPGSAGKGTEPRGTSQLTIGGQPAGPSGPKLRSRRVLVAASACVVVLAVALGLIVTRSPASAAPAFTFRPQHYGDGLTVSQTWQLAGSRGTSLKVTVTAGNTTDKPVSAYLVEPIPGVVAANPHTVSFHPMPKLEVGPGGGGAAIWQSLVLPPNGHVVVSYVAPESPAGNSQARLMTFVDSFLPVASAELLKPITAGTALESLTIIPPAPAIYVGSSIKLGVRGIRSDGTIAAGRKLPRVVWASADPAVAWVNRDGVLIGGSPGSTTITARIGNTRAKAVVTVLPIGQAVPGGGSTITPTPSSFSSASSSPSSTSPSSSSSSVSPSPTTGSPTTGTTTPPDSPSAPASGAAAGGIVAGSR